MYVFYISCINIYIQARYNFTPKYHCVKKASLNLALEEPRYHGFGRMVRDPDTMHTEYCPNPL